MNTRMLDAPERRARLPWQAIRAAVGIGRDVRPPPRPGREATFDAETSKREATRDLRGRHGPAHTVRLPPGAEENHGREASHCVACSDRRERLRVDLRDDHRRRVRPRQARELGRHSATGPAPRCPEVHQDELGAAPRGQNRRASRGSRRATPRSRELVRPRYGRLAGAMSGRAFRWGSRKTQSARLRHGSRRICAS